MKLPPCSVTPTARLCAFLFGLIWTVGLGVSVDMDFARMTRTARGRGRGLWWRRRRTATRHGALCLEISALLSQTCCPALCASVWVDTDGRVLCLWTSGDSDNARQGTRVVVAPPPADGDEARRPKPGVFRRAESYVYIVISPMYAAFLQPNPPPLLFSPNPLNFII